MFGGIDAGGTSFRCIVASGPGDILAETQFPTATPEATLAKAVAFFATGPGRAVARIGVGCFGPVGIVAGQPDYGTILKTPKPGWSGVDVAGTIARGTGRAVAFDTDVNAAARGERRWGAGRGLDDLCYVTVGTGIGAGIMTGGKPLIGLLHPEVGHIYVPRHPEDLDFLGSCSIHGACLEGLASAQALAARWHCDPKDLPDDHPAWDFQAHYLAHLAVTLLLTTATARIIMGGGVMARPGLTEQVNAKAERLLHGYAASPRRPGGPLVVAPALGQRAGALGAIALAIESDEGS